MMCLDLTDIGSYRMASKFYYKGSITRIVPCDKTLMGPTNKMDSKIITYDNDIKLYLQLICIYLKTTNKEFE
jgi:hypothetical protein